MVNIFFIHKGMENQKMMQITRDGQVILIQKMKLRGLIIQLMIQSFQAILKDLKKKMEENLGKKMYC